MSTRRIGDAKASLRESLLPSDDVSPPRIARHGRKGAVIVSRAEHGCDVAAAPSLVEFMRRSPLQGAEDLAFERDMSPARDAGV